MDALIFDALIFIAETFVKDAFETFIVAVDDIEKFPVTDKLVKLIFVLTVPYGRPFTVVTLIVLTFNTFIDPFITDAFDTFKFLVERFVIDTLDVFNIPGINTASADVPKII